MVHDKEYYFINCERITTYSMLVLMIVQLINAIITLSTLTQIGWIILVLTRFILGVSTGFVETGVNTLVFKWCKNDPTKASAYSIYLREFGHISARLLLVPIVYLTFSNDQNIFWAVFVGFGWLLCFFFVFFIIFFVCFFLLFGFCVIFVLFFFLNV